MAFDWTGLLGSAQKSQNNALYSALLGAKGANDPKAAQGFLADNKLNPAMGGLWPGEQTWVPKLQPQLRQRQGMGGPQTLLLGVARTMVVRVLALSRPLRPTRQATRTPSSRVTGPSLHPTIGYDAMARMSTTAGDGSPGSAQDWARQEADHADWLRRWDEGLWDRRHQRHETSPRTFLTGREAQPRHSVLVDIAQGCRGDAQKSRPSDTFHWNDYLQQINDTAATERECPRLLATECPREQWLLLRPHGDDLRGQGHGRVQPTID
jgi:hypothetical protein